MYNFPLLQLQLHSEVMKLINVASILCSRPSPFVVANAVAPGWYRDAE